MIYDLASIGIGAGGMLVLVFIVYVIKSFFKRKSKHDLHLFKKIVYESGIKTKEVYENMLELEKAFKDIEQQG